MAYSDYATLAEVRAEGLTVTMASDSVVQTLLLNANQLVERLTKQFFISRAATLTFDGNNSYLLHLPFPIITCASLKINNSSTDLDTSYYRIFNGRGGADVVDHRANPKIELRRTAEYSIYSLTDDRFFYKGYDQTLTGTFGFTESDGSVPAPINRAVISLVMLNATLLYDAWQGRTMSNPVGSLKREKTDDHEMEWFVAGEDFKHLVVPQSIHNLLKEYRAPMAMGVASVRWLGDA